MKTYRLSILSFLVMSTAFMQAEEIISLYKSPTFMRPLAGLKIKDQSYLDKYSLDGEKTLKWFDTENAHKTHCWAETVPFADDEKLPPFPEDKEYVPQGFELTQEHDETVLHCYLRMPSEVLTNIWLASDASVIVDKETGVRYLARRCVPDCWDMHLWVKAPVGSVLDLQVIFPLLPPTTSEVIIFGVPAWFLSGYNGMDIKLNNRTKSKQAVITYDEAPNLRVPTLIREEHGYNKDLNNTWAAYTNFQLIKPTNDYTMAIWRTYETTYLAISGEMKWEGRYWDFPSGTVLVDETGKQYKLREVQGIIMDHHFWANESPGDFIAFVLEFEPIPLNVTTLSYIEPPSEPFKVWGAKWNGMAISNLNVEELRANQSLFTTYHERVTVK